MNIHFPLYEKARAVTKLPYFRLSMKPSRDVIGPPAWTLEVGTGPLGQGHSFHGEVEVNNRNCYEYLCIFVVPSPSSLFPFFGLPRN